MQERSDSRSHKIHHQPHHKPKIMKTKIVSILFYDDEKHQLSSNIRVQEPSTTSETTTVSATEHSPSPNSPKQNDTHEVTPSKDWTEAYKRWNTFGDNHKLPVFQTLKDLHEFNERGEELTKRLEEEFQDDPNVFVAAYKPLYSNVSVGDAGCTWWYVKDANYNFVIPYQKLPISDDLKSKFQAWKCHKDVGWADDEKRAELNQEGHDLEEHLLWELNITIPYPGTGALDAPCAAKPLKREGGGIAVL